MYPIIKEKGTTLTKEELLELNKYKKLKGILKVEELLPNITPLNGLAVIRSVTEWRKAMKEYNFLNKELSVRFDSNIGVNSKIPGSQTVKTEDVEGLIKRAEQECENWIAIVEDLKDGSNDRITTNGAVNVTLCFNEFLVLEWVGPCFDGRELCSGKAVHQSWKFPWDSILFLKPYAINETTYKLHEASSREYFESAIERANFLCNSFKSRKREIISRIPNELVKMPTFLFEEILNGIIIPLYEKNKEFRKLGNKEITVEVMITEKNELIPMEIGLYERFKKKEILNNENIDRNDK